MKKNISKTIIFLTVTVLAVGCKKITDINVSPNNPPVSDATPAVLFPSAVGSTAGIIGGEFNILGGLWAEMYTQAPLASQFSGIDSYSLTKSNFQDDWSELYAGALEDYQTSIATGTAAGEYNYVLMATCMKAYTLEVLADLYDQVPYTEAFKGAANTQPHFDSGHTVYEGLLKEIQAALANDYNHQLGTPSTDFVFGADNNEMAEWAEFAHTLELKMYLRMINAFPDEASAGVKALYANPDFLSVNAGMTQFVNTLHKDNPFYDYNILSLNSPTNLKASVTFASYLSSISDTLRAAAYFNGSFYPASTPDPFPIKHAVNQGDYISTYSNNPESPYQTPTDPVWFISEAESYFLRAEAVARYSVIDPEGTDADLYKKGVEASFVANHLTVAQADAFLATHAGVAYPATGTLDAKIQAIMMEKWISGAQGCHTLEAVFDQWRTGYPQISKVYSTNANYVAGQWVYSANGVTPTHLFPKRLIFPGYEVNENKNTPAIVPIYTPVWWALSTTADQ